MKGIERPLFVKAQGVQSDQSSHWGPFIQVSVQYCPYVHSGKYTRILLLHYTVQDILLILEWCIMGRHGDQILLFYLYHRHHVCLHFLPKFIVDFKDLAIYLIFWHNTRYLGNLRIVHCGKEQQAKWIPLSFPYASYLSTCFLPTILFFFLEISNIPCVDIIQIVFYTDMK